MMESVTELTEKQFEEFAKKGIVFIDFFADWCMPCVMMAPIVEDVSQSFNGKIKFGKVNVNDNENLARKFDVSSIPTFIVFKDGKKIEEFTGAMDGNELEDKLNKFV
jgi:thioredoxin 1